MIAYSTETEYDGKCAVKLSLPSHFDLSQIFDCGQAFRFLPIEGNEMHVGGVAYGRYIELLQNERELIISNTCMEDYESIWKHYLSLDMDYDEVERELSCAIAPFDKLGVFPLALQAGEGIRILRQEPWECLCSFIISQNNNIPRIRSLIDALCRAYGEPIVCTDATYYSFPSAAAVADAGLDAMRELKMGFRAKYIYEAACAVSSGRLELDALLSMSKSDAEAVLCSLNGVGPKVASCVMLFSLEKYNAFPIDVWVKRILEKYYPDGLDIGALGRYAGIAQQYLFYYERYNVGK